MENSQTGPPSVSGHVVMAAKKPRTLVHCSDDENDREEFWEPEIDPNRSVRSDEGYASRRRRAYKGGHSLARSSHVQRRAGDNSECSSGAENSQTEDLLKSDSSSSLRISSEDEHGHTKQTAKHLSPQSLFYVPVGNFQTDNQTQHKVSDTAESENADTDFNQASLFLEEISGRINDRVLPTDVAKMDEINPSLNSTTGQEKCAPNRKSSSSPDLYENFFSRTPLCVAGQERAMVHRSTHVEPGVGVTPDRARTDSIKSSISYTQRTGQHAPLDQTEFGTSSLPLALNLSTKYRHGVPNRQLAFQDYESKQQNEQLREPLHQVHVQQLQHYPDRTKTYNQQQQQQLETKEQLTEYWHKQNESYLNQQQQTEPASTMRDPDPAMVRDSSSPDSPLMTPDLGDGNGTAYALNGGPPIRSRLKKAEAGEDTSQFSSVSSCYSLTDNIHRHTSKQGAAAAPIDFGHLKSAMKKSSQNEGQSQRKLSLFNSVMRRVSIHRRESTPTGRIATFLFGADDARERGKKSGSDTDSKDVSGESLLEMQRAKRAANLRESLFQILSGLYGIMIVILGAVIPITEIFISEDIDSTFEGFYVYLYIVSILFLVYVYAYLLRRNRLKTELITRTLSRSLSWSKAWARGLARADTETRSKVRKRMISLDVSNHHTGTFYLRLGVLGFGIGSMIHSGLNFGSFVSVSGEHCSEPIQWVKPLIHLMFTFFQLYFIFMNSKMCIHRYKKLARFGLVHMSATNICVWFRAIVVETLHVIHHSEAKGHVKGHHNRGDSVHTGSYNSSGHHGGHEVRYGSSAGDPHSQHTEGAKSLIYVNVSDVIHLGRKLKAASAGYDSGHADMSMASKNLSMEYPQDKCHWMNMMTKAVEAAAPYLYPCTIEYSLMCAGILYIMWTNVGKRPRRPTRSELETDSEGGDDEDEQRSQRMSVDCTSSSRGLFLGILLMVGTIISIIAFYMLVNQEEMGDSAIILTHMSGTFIYTVTLLALLLAAGRMKSLSFHNQQEANLEDILIIISYTGLLCWLLVFIIFRYGKLLIF
ncbi:otopetrin-2-like [Elysia marginata]|uniref:Otopetrin-2-like n=1 Tax=Elysia marginata TaxID=1093978 RepID=A0AAV4JDB0_9GAST|nr:otopetrin-2-like [Elysia marginata]